MNELNDATVELPILTATLSKITDFESLKLKTRLKLPHFMDNLKSNLDVNGASPELLKEFIQSFNQIFLAYWLKLRLSDIRCNMWLNTLTQWGFPETAKHLLYDLCISALASHNHQILNQLFELSINSNKTDLILNIQSRSQERLLALAMQIPIKNFPNREDYKEFQQKNITFLLENGVDPNAAFTVNDIIFSPLAYALNQGLIHLAYAIKAKGGHFIPNETALKMIPQQIIQNFENYASVQNYFDSFIQKASQLLEKNFDYTEPFLKTKDREACLLALTKEALFYGLYQIITVQDNDNDAVHAVTLLSKLAYFCILLKKYDLLNQLLSQYKGLIVENPHPYLPYYDLYFLTVLHTNDPKALAVLFSYNDNKVPTHTANAVKLLAHAFQCNRPRIIKFLLEKSASIIYGEDNTPRSCQANALLRLALDKQFEAFSRTVDTYSFKDAVSPTESISYWLACIWPEKEVWPYMLKLHPKKVGYYPHRLMQLPDDYDPKAVEMRQKWAQSFRKKILAKCPPSAESIEDFDKKLSVLADAYAILCDIYLCQMLLEGLDSQLHKELYKHNVNLDTSPQTNDSERFDWFHSPNIQSIPAAVKTFSALNTVLLKNEQAHGINLKENHPQNDSSIRPIPVCKGFVPSETLNPLLKSGFLFNEDPTQGNALIHGKYAHRIQFFILMAAAKNNFLDLQGLQLIDVLKFTLDDRITNETFNLWGKWIDWVNPSPLPEALQPKLFRFTSPEKLTEALLNTNNPKLRHIKAFMRNDFYRTLGKLMKRTNYSAEFIVRILCLCNLEFSSPDVVLNPNGDNNSNGVIWKKETPHSPRFFNAEPPECTPPHESKDTTGNNLPFGH